jgi:octaprenyl-diphosphate synthase
MKDDVLDVTADERSVGKPVGNDLTERKMTIPLICALQNRNPAFRTEVERFYRGQSSDGIAQIVQGIADEGGIAATNSEIARFADRAIAALQPIAESPAKEQLAKLAGALLAE